MSIKFYINYEFLWPLIFLFRLSSNKIKGILAFITLSRVSTTLKIKLFENIVGKRKNTCDQHFLLLRVFFSVKHLCRQFI